MRVRLAALLFLPLLLNAAGVLRIGNATDGANIGALQMSALKQSMENNTEISIEKCKVQEGFSQLASGKIDLLLAEARDIPENFKGTRRKWAAEALTLYVTSGSPLQKITPGELRRLMTEDQPPWSRYGGGLTEIQRIALKPDAQNGELETRWSNGKERSKRIFRVSSTEQGFRFLNENGVFLGGFTSERSARIAVVAVDGVSPMIDTVLSGKYPLARVYWFCFSRITPQIQAFLSEISGNEHYQMIQESGLLPALQKGN